MTWHRLGVATLSSSSDNLTTDTISTPTNTINILSQQISTGGTFYEGKLRFGTNGVVRSTTDYNSLYWYNFNSMNNSTFVGVSEWHIFNNSGVHGFTVGFFANIDGKLKIGFYTHKDSTGDRITMGVKLNTYTDQVDKVDLLDVSSSETFVSGSNLIVLGDEPNLTISVKLQDGTIFEETDTNKAYIWNASTSTWTQL